MRDLFAQEPAAPLAEALRPKTLDQVVGAVSFAGRGQATTFGFSVRQTTLHDFLGASRRG